MDTFLQKSLACSHKSFWAAMHQVYLSKSGMRSEMSPNFDFDGMLGNMIRMTRFQQVKTYAERKIRL